MSQTEFAYKIVDKKRKAGEKARATITKVQIVKAMEIFGAKAKDQEQQLYSVYDALSTGSLSKRRTMVFVCCLLFVVT